MDLALVLRNAASYHAHPLDKRSLVGRRFLLLVLDVTGDVDPEHWYGVALDDEGCWEGRRFEDPEEEKPNPWFEDLPAALSISPLSS